MVLTIYVYPSSTATIPADGADVELTVEADADSAAGPVLTPMFTLPPLE